MTDVFRKEYKPLSQDQKTDIEWIKKYAHDLLDAMEKCGTNYSVDNRAMALAKTNLEQAVMWAIKAIT